MNKEDLEKSNRSKYGEKSEDLIARTYKQSIVFGDVWCCKNAERYVDRFSRPDSSKGLNKTDLIKALDYIDRAIEKNPIPDDSLLEVNNIFVSLKIGENNEMDEKSKSPHLAIYVKIFLNNYLHSRNAQELLKAKVLIEQMCKLANKKAKEIIE